jgi:Fe-S-cluster containining protein
MLESFGLNVEDGDDSELLIQPCGALKGTRCSIYQHRPKCCRTFECRLLRDVMEGKRTRVDAGQIIQETRDLVTEINRGIETSGERRHLPLKERYMEELERSGEGRPELEEAMRKLEDRIELNFLL